MHVVFSPVLASAIWIGGGSEARGGTLTFTETDAAGKPQRFYHLEVL